MSDQTSKPNYRKRSLSWREDRAALEAAGVILSGDVVAAHLEGRERAEHCLSTLRTRPCGDELLADAIMVSAESRTRRAFLTGFLIRVQKAIVGEVPA